MILCAQVSNNNRQANSQAQSFKFSRPDTPIIMPTHSNSASPMRHPTALARTSSQQSITRGNPDTTATKTKQNRTSLGRIHARTPSYGKNLHKLTKIVDSGMNVPDSNMAKKKPTSPTSPGHATPVKRNTSTSNLLRNATKAPIRKNKSEVSLVRNHSALHLHKGKNAQPLRKSDSHGKELDKAKHHKHTKKLINEDDDGDWTEESASPAMTRQSSLSKVSRQQSSSSSPPPVQEVMMEPDGSEDISPGSPPDIQLEMANFRNTARVQLLDRRQSRDTTYLHDVTASHHILSGRTLAGEASPSARPSQGESITVNGSTPYPSNGVSQFLGTSLQTLVPGGSYMGREDIVLTIPEDPASIHDPSVLDRTLRPSASAANLTNLPLIFTEDLNTVANIPSYTFAPTGANRAGAATQNKLNLWKSQNDVKPSDGPPIPMLKDAPMETLNNDERRMRLWENAEKELSAVRRFVNPVLESAKRASAKDKSNRQSNGLHINGTTHGLHPGSVETKTSNSNGAARRDQDKPRPASRAGPRSVRFEVGMDSDSIKDDGSVEPLDEILRRLWNTTNEGTSVEG